MSGTAPTQVDVVIIGAGIAGLAAANVLKQFRPVVLEARDRMGGRALTKYINDDYDAPVDLGCSMVHGLYEGNPLKRALKELGLVSHRSYWTTAGADQVWQTARPSCR